MYTSGAPIDISTLKPLGEVEKDREAERQATQHHRHEQQAAFMGTLASPAGEQLLAMIGERLTDRIDILIKSDPEATAYVQILRTLGEQSVLARRAARKIMERQLRTEDQGKETPE